MGQVIRPPKPAGGSHQVVGAYRLVCEAARGFFGPLWVGHDVLGQAEPTTVFVRRVRVGGARKRLLSPLIEAAEQSRSLAGSGPLPVADVLVRDDQLDIVSPYIEAEPLRSLLRAAAYKRRAIPQAVSIRVLCDALTELAAAQRAFVESPHRGFGGVQPDSILVGTDGATRWVDLGVASAATLTEPWKRDPNRLGYMAPEQLAVGETLTAAADVFAAGILLWEMLANRRLFPGADPGIIRDKIRSSRVPRLDEVRLTGGESVPKALADVVEKALSFGVSDRYAGLAEFAGALRDVAPAAGWADVATTVTELVGPIIDKRRLALERFIAAGPTGHEPEAPQESEETEDDAVGSSESSAAEAEELTDDAVLADSDPPRASIVEVEPDELLTSRPPPPSSRGATPLPAPAGPPEAEGSQQPAPVEPPPFVSALPDVVPSLPDAAPAVVAPSLPDDSQPREVATESSRARALDGEVPSYGPPSATAGPAFRRQAMWIAGSALLGLTIVAVAVASLSGEDEEREASPGEADSVVVRPAEHAPQAEPSAAPALSVGGEQPPSEPSASPAEDEEPAKSDEASPASPQTAKESVPVPAKRPRAVVPRRPARAARPHRPATAPRGGTKPSAGYKPGGI